MGVAAEAVFVPEGDLTMTSAGARLAEGLAMASRGDLTVDLSALKESDSAALGLLFAWQRAARAAGHQLTVRGLPPGLASLARLYGVLELLPDEEVASSV